MPPAVYIDADYYYSMIGAVRPGASSPEAQARMESMFESASRLYDRASGVAPGHWAPISSTPYVFRGDGTDTLYLRDDMGRQYFLRTITADSCKIDTDADGSFDDYLLDLDDLWLEALPINASAFGQPYTALRLRAGATGATITTWPDTEFAVQITGTWGYSTPPDAVKARVADIAHGLSQRGYAGGTGSDESLQQGIPVWVMRMVDAEYNQRIPAL